MKLPPLHHIESHYELSGYRDVERNSTSLTKFTYYLYLIEDKNYMILLYFKINSNSNETFRFHEDFNLQLNSLKHLEVKEYKEIIDLCHR